SDLKPQGQLPTLATVSATMQYDTVNDVVVVNMPPYRTGSGTPAAGIYVYDPAANTWNRNPAPFPKGFGPPRYVVNGFYDPELNVHYYHLSNDSEDDGSMWVYRYRRAR